MAGPVHTPSPLSPTLGYLFHDAARLMKREFEAEAREHKLTLPQMRVIAQLGRSDGLSQTALAGLCDANPMTLSDIIDRLETHGLVRREVDPADSRAKLVWITAKARHLAEELRNVGLRVYERALAEVSEADRAALIRILTTITQNLAGERRAELEDTL